MGTLAETMSLGNDRFVDILTVRTFKGTDTTAPSEELARELYDEFRLARVPVAWSTRETNAGSKSPETILELTVITIAYLEHRELIVSISHIIQEWIRRRPPVGSVEISIGEDRFRIDGLSQRALNRLADAKSETLLREFIEGHLEGEQYEE